MMPTTTTLAPVVAPPPAMAAWTAAGWPASLDRLPWPPLTVLALTVTGATALLTLGAYLAGRRRSGRNVTTRPDGDGSGIETASAQRRWRAVEMVLTLAAAGIATATAVTGMWRVFTDALGFTGPGRIALVGFLEIALMVSAIRARRSLRETGTVGVDGAAVWVLALFSAVLSAADAHTNLARTFRFVAPLVAAFMWDRGLASDRRRATRPRGEDGEPPSAREAIAWRLSPRRAAVRVGLADPVSRTAADDDRGRRLARLTQARLRLEVLETTQVPAPLAWVTLRPARRTLAAWRLQRHALSAVKYLQLGTDPAVTAEITTTVATVVGLRQATSPRTLAEGDNPWTGAIAAAPNSRQHHARPERLGLPAGTGHRPARVVDVAGCEHAGGSDTDHTQPVGHTLSAEHAPVEHAGPGSTRPEHTSGTTARVSSTFPARRARAAPIATDADRAPAGTRSAASGPTDPRLPQSDDEIVRIAAAADPLPSVRQIKATYRVGNTRAARIRAAAERHATTRERPAAAVTTNGTSPVDDQLSSIHVRPPFQPRPPEESTALTEKDNTESSTQERKPGAAEDQKQNPEQAPHEDPQGIQDEEHQGKAEEHHTHAVDQP